MQHIEPGGRVLVEVGENLFSKGTVIVTGNAWIRVRLDHERVVHEWRPDQVAPLTEILVQTDEKSKRFFGEAA